MPNDELSIRNGCVYGDGQKDDIGQSLLLHKQKAPIRCHEQEQRKPQAIKPREIWREKTQKEEESKR